MSGESITLDTVISFLPAGAIVALVAGFTSYFLAERKFQQELKKNCLEDLRNSLREAAKSFESSITCIDEFMSILDLSINHQEPDLKKIEFSCKAELSKAFKNVGDAISLTNLIGETNLRNKLKEYCEVIADLDEVTNTFRDGLPEDGRGIEAIRSRGAQICDDIHDLFQQAFRKTVV
ncbi:hypothetical protein M2G46_22705 [Vibrio vulnificus]|nr:hypothetical protein [Vibrio vulnificus]